MFGLLLVMAFAVAPAGAQESQPCNAGEPLCVKKDGAVEATRTWEWDITKTGDQTDLTLSPGQFFPVNYEVTVSATSSETWTVTGGIWGILNQSGASQTITSISDTLSDGTVATLTCPPGLLPRTLAAGNSLGSGQPENPLCTYTATGSGPVPTSNTVTVYISDGAGGEIVGATRTVNIFVTRHDRSGSVRHRDR